ncbi:hypothetical protein ABH920_000735 [Catenulispora sp. EB89]|uniref:hypothetical protein n=1 Tax=Catenulispora sp. EB89 TaxID=3156257 RepID=UPI0035116346
MPEMRDAMRNDGVGGETNIGETNIGRVGGIGGIGAGDTGDVSTIGDEMNDDFRGVLADVLDGRAWAGYAGPGAAVRRRGHQRRRRVAATSAAGVAIVAAAVAATSAGLATGRSAPGPGAVTAGRSTTAAPGRYVKVSEALMQPADLGPDYTTAGTVGPPGPFRGLFCAPIAPVSVVGSTAQREFAHPSSKENGIVESEHLYQFPDAASAKAAFSEVRSAAQAGGCRDGAGAVSSFQDVGGAGDAMFTQRNYGGPTMAVSAVVLEGQVVVVNELMPESAEAVWGVSADWLTAVSKKAADRVRNAPRTDVPEPVPATTQPTSPPTGGSAPGSVPSSVPSSAPLPVSQPVDGFLFAPADLGPSFGADTQDAWQSGQSQIIGATAVSGMMFRGTISSGDGEFLVNEGVYTFADASAAQTGLAAYDQSTQQTKAKSEPLSGLGDQAWIKHWAGERGGVTVAIRVGGKLITFDVLAGGSSADQPIPGGDAWVRQIAHQAVQRLAAAK